MKRTIFDLVVLVAVILCIGCAGGQEEPDQAPRSLPKPVSGPDAESVAQPKPEPIVKPKPVAQPEAVTKPEPVVRPKPEPVPPIPKPIKARPPEATTHKLTVTTEPPAMCAVYIDGTKAENNAGNAPVTVSLPAGPHAVYFMVAPGGGYSLAGTSPMNVDLQSDMTISMPLKKFNVGPE
ncbi:MAG: PEGA domain-containing protein [Myxococcota bacterium]|nr:PEGA domain-containing protein [Myxococcota bacterium]